MSFAGVSVVADGRLLQPSAASAIYSGTASGSWYHLLVVEGYSRVKTTPTGKHIKGRSFRAGGYRWALEFYPNGNPSESAGFVSLFLVLDQHVAQPVKVQLRFTFIDEVDKQEPAGIRAEETCDFNTSDPAWGSRFIKGEDLEKSEHLKDDCFTIRCDFIIAEAAATPFIEVPSSNICEHLNHLFATKVGADVTFEVGRETFAAHRCVLAARSTVFMAELFGPMKEGTTTACAIQIQDMEPNVFKALLGFVYTDTMPKMEAEGEADEAGGGAEITWLRHLLAAADRYHLQRLKSMCEERLSRCIDVSSVTAILSLAAQHHCRGLKEACLEFLTVQSAADLRGAMATSDWEHVATTDHSVLNELIAKLASKVQEKTASLSPPATVERRTGEVGFCPRVRQRFRAAPTPSAGRSGGGRVRRVRISSLMYIGCGWSAPTGGAVEGMMPPERNKSAAVFFPCPAWGLASSESRRLVVLADQVVRRDVVLPPSVRHFGIFDDGGGGGK